jgi:hypothetical protein
MDEAERALWCKAWKILVLNGENSGSVIDIEIERCLAQHDDEGAEHWRRIALAVADLGK